MKFRFLTAGAVLATWLLIYSLGLTKNALATLIPIAVLAFFQIGEKSYLRNLSGKRQFIVKQEGHPHCAGALLVMKSNYLISTKRSVSSWILIATVANFSAYSLPWWAQNMSSPPVAKTARTQAWAPQRSQRSKAFRGVDSSRTCSVIALSVRVVISIKRIRGYRCPLTMEHHASSFYSPRA